MSSGDDPVPGRPRMTMLGVFSTAARGGEEVVIPLPPQSWAPLLAPRTTFRPQRAPAQRAGTLRGTPERPAKVMAQPIKATAVRACPETAAPSLILPSVQALQTLHHLFPNGPTDPPAASGKESSGRWFLDHSIVAQMDALIFSVFRRRLEFDATATEASSSYTSLFGKMVSPLSTVCAIFSAHAADMPNLLRRAIKEKATGLFICKEAPDSGPREFEGRTWFDFLNVHAALRFEFRGEFCRDVSPSEGRFFCPLHTIRALFISFNTATALVRKSVKRKEKKFGLEVCKIPLSDGKVGMLPLHLARISPLAPQRGSAPHGAAQDSAPPSKPETLFEGFPEPKPAKGYNLPLLRSIAAFYPLTDVADIALEAASETGFDSGYTGDRSRRVSANNMVSDEAKVTLIRARLTEEVAAGRMAGPFKRCPFPNSWCKSQGKETPLGMAAKFKYNPESDEFRLVSDFSFNHPSSTNDLSWNPELVDCCLQVFQLMAILAELGANAQMFTVDQKKAFRMQAVKHTDLHLYVYRLSDSEFFVELRHPFGHITSEFCFHALTSVIGWALPFIGIATRESPVVNFVDNWFLAAKEADESFTERSKNLEQLLTDLGAEIHEQQRGPRFNALGWNWDTRAMTITCPDEKLTFYRNRFQKWANECSKSKKLTLKKAQKVMGILNFLSTAAPSLKASVGFIKACSKKASNGKAGALNLTRGAQNAMSFVASFLIKWPGTRAFCKPFSPRDSWENLMRTDASSDFGYGGVVIPLNEGTSGPWSTEERAMALHPNLLAESSTVLELLALRNVLKVYGQRIRGTRVQIEMDSQTSVQNLRRWDSEKLPILEIVNEIHDLVISFCLEVRFEFIPREFNEIADALSIDSFPQASEMFEREFGGQLTLTSASRL